MDIKVAKDSVEIMNLCHMPGQPVYTGCASLIYFGREKWLVCPKR